LLAYDDDGRICQRHAALWDPQRGFMVCHKHSRVRETQTENENETSVMSKTKPPPDGAAAAPVAGTNDQREYRNIPEIDARIDGYIKENPKRWAYIQTMPRDRLERALVLNEIQKIDRQQRVRDGVIGYINRNPELKQAYETLVKNVPEDQREAVMVQIARQTSRTVSRSQSVA